MTSNAKTTTAVIVTVVAALLVGGTAYLMSTNNSTSIVPPVATSTAPITPAPTPIAPPAAPQPGAPVVVTDASPAVSNSTAVLTGKVTPNGSQTSYWFEYGTSTSLGTRSPSQSIGSGFITISAPAYITGLSPSTAYYYRLSAKNSFGTVEGQLYSFTTSASTPPPKGNAPNTRSNAATSISRTTANVNGRVNANGSQTSYWFEYGTSTSLGAATALQSAGSGTADADVTLSLSDLQPAIKYYFRLNAQNQYGTVNGAILSFTTQGPPAPTAPVANTDAATSVATSSVVLNGKVTPNGAETTYWFEYSTDSLLGNIIGTTSPEKSAGSAYTAVTVNETLTDLPRNTRYYFRLVARNAHGTVRGDTMNFRTK